MCWNIIKRARICWYIPEYAGMCWNIPDEAPDEGFGRSGVQGLGSGSKNFGQLFEKVWFNIFQLGVKYASMKNFVNVWNSHR